MFAQDAQALLDLTVPIQGGRYLLECLFRPGERWAGDQGFGSTGESKVFEIFLMQIVASALPDRWQGGSQS